MKVIVVGSGLAGLTSAYFLAEAGCDVTILDRQPGPGLETSFANGALLTPSMADPWNSPGSWQTLLSSLVTPHSALKLRLKAIPGLWRWGIDFLRSSSAGCFTASTISNLRLSLYSLEAMDALQQVHPLSFGERKAGTLRIFNDHASLERALTAARLLKKHGLAFERLDRAALVALEPALNPIAGELVGGIHYSSDRSGDAHRFCVGLCEALTKMGVAVRSGTEVSRIDVRSGKATGVIVASNYHQADKIVIAAGSFSTGLMAGAGLRLPIQPVKGYSITFPTDGSTPVLSIPIVDDARHAAVVPLEGAVRLVGTAEFAGYDLRLRRGPINDLMKLADELLPSAKLSRGAAQKWCGLRPMSADGVPIIGATPIENLFVNSGQGHLGWTMAAGSGKLLADLMAGHSPAVDPAPYSPLRFTLGHC